MGAAFKVVQDMIDSAADSVQEMADGGDDFITGLALFLFFGMLAFCIRKLTIPAILIGIVYAIYSLAKA